MARNTPIPIIREAERLPRIHIEIHGELAHLLRVKGIKDDIKEYIEESAPDLINHFRISVYTDKVEDFYCDEMPYLRIYSTDSSDFDRLNEIIKPLDMEIEPILLYTDPVQQKTQ